MLIPDLLYLLLLSLLGSIVALIAGLIFLYKENWSDFLEEHSVPFAAGVLITVTLVGLLPEAIYLSGENVLIVVLASFFGAYIFEHLLFSLHHHNHNRGHDHQDQHQSSVPLVLVGDTIHNFIDGVAIGASFLISPGMGLVTAASTFLHEIPHEIGDFGILLKAGWSRGKVLWVNALSACATIVGAFSLLLFAENEAMIGSLLAVSAGIFLYLGASDFLPHVELKKKGKLGAILPLTIGILAMLLTLKAIPHSHDHDEAEHDHQEVHLENHLDVE